MKSSPLKMLWRMAKLPVPVYTLCFSVAVFAADFPTQPADTGVSGVYEVMVGTTDAEKMIAHFDLFGFRPIAEKKLDADAAFRIYGIRAGLRSVRMQNADTDAHGLLRILEWENLLPGVGYARPDTPGQRMAVMRTADIMRIVDVFKDERRSGQPWLVQEPVLDNIYQSPTESPGLHDRRIAVRETGIWGAWFNHIFFQRYGYDLPGYGYLNEDSVFRASEFTHHDFILDKPLAEMVGYYVTALGFKPEQQAPVINGDWQPGARAVFSMPPGHSHEYMGMVSPNNIAGKLKFFHPLDRVFSSRIHRVAINAEGINMHSLFVDNLSQVKLLLREEGIESMPIVKNEFGEDSFVFTGPDNAHWQVLKLGKPPDKPPVTEFKLIDVNH